MSIPPTSAPPPSNGLGIAAFILSLISIFTLGLLAPIALLLSFIALFKRPRGFAFAGFVISLVCTLFIAAVLSFFGFIIFSGFKYGKPFIATVVSAEQLRARLNTYALNNGGEPPDDLTGNAQIAGTLDGWGRPFRYTRTAQTSFEIRSASQDGIFDTQDDYEQRFTIYSRGP